MLTGLEMDVDWLLIGFDWILLDVDLIILFTFFFSLDATLSLGIKMGYKNWTYKNGVQVAPKSSLVPNLFYYCDYDPYEESLFH